MENENIKKEDNAEAVTKDVNDNPEVKETDCSPKDKEQNEKTDRPSKKEIKNKLKDENQRLQQEVAILKNDLLRNRADLENFKKHMKEEQIKDRKYASVNLVSDLLTPIDYLNKACGYQTDNPEMQNFLIGFKMIAKQLADVLVSDGLQEIKTAIGDDFDPTIHHAMESIEQEGVEPGKILEVLATGYKYKERIIKPAMVKVSK